MDCCILSNIDFKQLELFVVLSEELHFAKTAQRCHMTASALTRSIQRLEQTLNVSLLLRNNRNVELTPAGKNFAEYARSALRQWQTIQQTLLLQSAQVTGQLRLYGSATAGYGVLSKLLTGFRLQYPKVELQLHTGDQAAAIENVKAGKEDVAIAALPEDLPQTIAFKPLLSSPLRFIMPQEEGVVTQQIDTMRQHALHGLNIAKLPLIVSERGLARKRLDDWFRHNNQHPNIYAQVSAHEAIVTLVALGFGIGLVPELVVQHSPFRDKIQVMADAPNLQAFQIGLCVLKSRLSVPAVKAFWEVADSTMFSGRI